MNDLEKFCYTWFNGTSRRDWRGWTVSAAESHLDMLLRDPDIDDDDRIPACTTAEQLYESMADVIAEHDRLTIGERIRDARENADLTQTELAEQIGVTQSAIGKYERGELDISVTRLIAIMQAVGAGPEILAGL